jgi:hypothetical protein
MISGALNVSSKEAAVGRNMAGQIGDGRRDGRGSGRRVYREPSAPPSLREVGVAPTVRSSRDDDLVALRQEVGTRQQKLLTRGSR